VIGGGQTVAVAPFKYPRLSKVSRSFVIVHLLTNLPNNQKHHLLSPTTTTTTTTTHRQLQFNDSLSYSLVVSSASFIQPWPNDKKKIVQNMSSSEELSSSITEMEATATSTSFLTALVAGGMAGTSVDVALFPIDTLKTRLQSPQGFMKAGGFHGIYNGLGAAAVGSAPGAALFFSTYEVSWNLNSHYGVSVAGTLFCMCVLFYKFNSFLTNNKTFRIFLNNDEQLLILNNKQTNKQTTKQL
jgi:hypothetical protein